MVLLFHTNRPKKIVSRLFQTGKLQKIFAYFPRLLRNPDYNYFGPL